MLGIMLGNCLWIGFIIWLFYQDYRDWKYYKDKSLGNWHGSNRWSPWRLW